MLGLLLKVVKPFHTPRSHQSSLTKASNLVAGKARQRSDKKVFFDFPQSSWTQSMLFCREVICNLPVHKGEGGRQKIA